MSNGNWTRTSKEKVVIFAEHLEKTTFQSHAHQHDEKLNFVGDNEEWEEINLTTPKEITRLIERNINTKKTPGYDLINGEILKKLSRKGIVKLTNLINAALRLKHVPMCWKVAEVVMVPKPGKLVNEVSSYRSISLLTIKSKVFEKILAIRTKIYIEKKKLIPNHQFGFRNKHTTNEQVYRITDITEKALEEEKICTAVFLDVAQAFNKVWH